ncbi:DnaJ domain-containing protein [Luteimonas saliphila]|uniref:DnaJ domain-containing protein n=1 Tax=Luteimonas saliphila TaxID=2804919 RepID=UPI00192D5CDA|nr:DnaJ domain-containing protein [Luteimonas saliphila]
MSGLEILAAASGLAIGYWLVSVFLSTAKPPADAAPEDAPEPDAPHVVDIGARHWTDVLGVPADADEAEIAAAYRRRAAEYHPDRGTTMANEIRSLASERTAEIDAAYDQAMRQLRRRPTPGSRE